MEQTKTLIQQKNETQNEILRCALSLFVTKGYFNTSLSEIACAAQLSQTQEIYTHFDSKQQLAATLYNSILDSLSVSIDEIRRRNKKAAEQLHSLVNLLFKLTEEAPEALRFLFLVNAAEFLPDEKPFLQTPAVNKMLKMIQLGINNGEIRSLAPMLIYSYFFGIINATLTLMLNGTLEKRSELYQSQAWLAAWNAIVKK
ncbi:MAG: TetR/AcrR family transcriptional regulator [Methylococcaceae bacterium]